MVSVAPVRQKTFSVSPIFSDSGFEFPKPSVLVYDSRFLLVDAQSLVSDSWLDPDRKWVRAAGGAKPAAFWTRSKKWGLCLPGHPAEAGKSGRPVLRERLGSNLVLVSGINDDRCHPWIDQEPLVEYILRRYPSNSNLPTKWGSSAEVPRQARSPASPQES